MVEIAAGFQSAAISTIPLNVGPACGATQEPHLELRRDHSANIRRARQQQAIACRTWYMAVRANCRIRDAKLTCEDTTQDRIEDLLNLLIINIIREGEYLENGHLGAQDMGHQIATRGRRRKGGRGPGEPERWSQVDVSTDDHVASLGAELNVLSRQAIVDLPTAKR